MEGTRVSYAAPRLKTGERRYGRVEAPNTSEWLDTRRRQKVRNQPNTIENNGKEVGVLLGGSLILQTVIGEVKVLSEGFQHSKTSYHPYTFAMYSSLWAYGGWANVPNVTAGVRKPMRNLPRLILTVIPFVTIVYLLMVISFFTVLTPKEMIAAEAIAVEWSKKVMGPVSFIIPLGVCLIALGNANNTFLTAGRLSSVAVHDGYIPEVLSYVNIKTRINLPAVIVRCIMCTIFIYIADVGMLIRFYVFTVWLFHGLTITGLLILRWKKRNYRIPYQVPIFIPIVVIIFSIGLVTLPFTVLPEQPSAEFIFSIALALVSLLGFFPFEKTKSLSFLLDQFTVFVQLILNVVPPKISRHTQSRHISRKRKWTPSNTKLNESLYRPGRFSTSSLDSLDTFSDDDTEEQRRRKISIASNYSVDYCDIMNNYDDQLNTENDSMLSGFSGRSRSNDCSSTESAESARRLSTDSSITYLAPDYKEVDSKL